MYFKAYYRKVFSQILDFKHKVNTLKHTNCYDVCRRIPLCLQNMGFNFRHCKLFHCNGVLYDQNAVTFGNILSEENKLRVLKALQKYDLPSLRKVTVAGDHRKAAVLIPLCSVKGEPSILFMVRSNKIPAHRGEVR